MKVALVTEWLDAWRGGAERSTLQFLHHLIDEGVDVHVYTRSRPSPTPAMSVHTINGAALGRTRKTVTFAHRVERALAAERFDIIHAISPCRMADIYQPRGGTVAESIQRNLALCHTSGSRAFKRVGNSLNVKQRYMLAVERSLLGRKTGPMIVAISDYVVRQLKRHYNVSDDRIRLIYNGIDPTPIDEPQRSKIRAEIRKEFGVGDGDCLVLLIAHNFKLKGVHRWMEAMRLLLDRGVSNVRSLVVGKGDSGRWHRLLAQLGLGDHLTMTGPSERIAEFHAAADLLVHPTYYDPCSRVVLEAMAAGLPCITTKWDGAAEMIEDGVNGRVLDDPDDVVGLADCMSELGDSAARSAMGVEARKVTDRISMIRHAREMVELYETLATGRADRR